MAALVPQRKFRLPWRLGWRLAYRPAHGDLPYDLTDLNFLGKFFSFATEDTDVYCPILSPDGTLMYMNGAATDRIYEYALSTPYDVTTATLNAFHSYIGQSITSTAMWISPNGQYLFLGDDIAGFIRRYTFGTLYDITTLTYDGVALAISQTTDGLTFSDDGLLFWAYEEDDSTWHEYSCSVPFQIASGTSSTGNKLVQDNANYGSMTTDGRNMIALGQGGSADAFKLVIRELAVPNIITTAEAVKFGATPMISDGKGVFFIETALKLYGLSVNNIVYEMNVFPNS